VHVIRYDGSIAVSCCRGCPHQHSTVLSEGREVVGDTPATPVVSTPLIDVSCTGYRSPASVPSTNTTSLWPDTKINSFYEALVCSYRSKLRPRPEQPHYSEQLAGLCVCCSKPTADESGLLKRACTCPMLGKSKRCSMVHSLLRSSTSHGHQCLLPCASHRCHSSPTSPKSAAAAR